jgi:hypothetical protein
VIRNGHRNGGLFGGDAMNSLLDRIGPGTRDPEDRCVNRLDQLEVREKMLDKTLADSFPASDPPSTDPAPSFDSFL